MKLQGSISVSLEWKYSNVINQLFIGFEKAYDSIERKSFDIILIKLGYHRIILTETCLNGPQSKEENKKMFMFLLVFPLRMV